MSSLEPQDVQDAGQVGAGAQREQKGACVLLGVTRPQRPQRPSCSFLRHSRDALASLPVTVVGPKVLLHWPRTSVGMAPGPTGDLHGLQGRNDHDTTPHYSPWQPAGRRKTHESGSETDLTQP